MRRTNPRLTLADPASYCIRVQGVLGESWSEYLGMTVEVEHNEAQHPITKLTGRVADQAALFGLLDSLYNLGFPLLSVECLAIR
jgi:hypothetical protein